MKTIIALPLLLLGACAAQMTSARVPSMAAAAMPGAPPPPLDRSVFSRDPNGSLSEDDLQRILESPIELDLPQRVGVLSVNSATDWHGPSPSGEVPSGVSAFASNLHGDMFTLVTDVMNIPSGGLGMQALREVAARYRLRYLVLYRQDLHQEVRANGVALGYITVLGAFFLPGQTLAVDGYLEASLFDVKTGLLLFTVRRSVHAVKDANVWQNDRKLDELEALVAARFAPKLAEDVRGDCLKFADAVKVENERREHAAIP
jgi:rhombotail lipoprotein